jgi:putative ABC transport system permease protein
MWRATLRGVLAHKLRLALSGLAIVLGVGFVSGTMIFTDTLSRTFTSLFETTAADVSVERARAFDAGLDGPGGSASYVPASLVEQVEQVDGVTAAEGYVQTEGVYVLDPDGEVVDTGGAPGIGVSWYENPDLSPSTLTEGRAPDGDGEVALDTGTVEETGYEVGDRVTLLTPGPRLEAELVGVFTFGETGGLAGASLTAFDLATAQQLIGQGDGLSGISVQAEQGRTELEVRDRVAAAVGADYAVKTRQETADEQAEALAEGLSFINIFLLVFAGVALFVGSFIILNTFSMLVAQRTRELALLRALGAGRAQVTRSVLVEAGLLGVVGSTVGLLAGFGIATGLRALFERFGLTLDGSLVFSPRTVAWSYVVGVLVTLLAAYLPARKAARTPPVAAMRDDHVAVEKSLRRRTVVGVVLAVLGVAGLVVGQTSDDGSQAASAVGLGAVALVLGAIALSPVLARPFVRVVGGVLPRIWGTTGHLARENALRNPRRTAATASALMIGLALVSAFSIIGASTNASIDRPRRQRAVGRLRRLDRRRCAVHPSGGGRHPRDRGRHGGHPAALRLGALRRPGVVLRGRRPRDAGRHAGARLRVRQHRGPDGDGLLVDEPTAESRGLAVGDVVPAVLPTGDTVDLTVGGVYEANGAVGPYVLSLETHAATGGTALDRYVYVDVDGDADAAAVRERIEASVASYPVVALKDQEEFAEEQRGQVGQLLLLINALLVLSVLIAVLGIVNTLALSVIERTREIGLLRAVGMDRSQLRRMVRLESVVISVFGAVLGLVLGSAFGISLTRALAGQGIEVLVVPGWRLALFLVIAALVGVLAAVWPARRAARLQVLEAIAH